MSLLSICQSVILQTGAGTTPAAIVSNTDTLPQQFLSWARKEVDLLARKHNWQALTAEHSIVTVASTESYALPADYSRYISDTFWDASNYWQMRGSIDPQMWQALKRGIIQSTIRKEFRVKGSLVFIYPTPTAVETLVGEYITSKPVTNTSGGAKATFTLDDDTTLIPEHVVELGLMWRYLRAKGFDYSEEFAEYESQRDLAIAQDSPAPSINFGVRTYRGLPYPNVPQSI